MSRRGSALAGALIILLTLGATRVQAHEGWGIVVLADGTVYFSDIPTNTIWKITPGGGLAVAVPHKHSHALVRGGDGSIYGTHEPTASRPGEVWRFTPGDGATTILTAGPDFRMSLHPFLRDASGAIYSTNRYEGPTGPHQLLRRSPGGEITVVAGAERMLRDGTSRDARFEGIDGIDMASDGSLYVVDGSRLRRVNRDGSVNTVAGPFSAPTFGEDAMGIHADAGGMIYVADYSGARVLRVQPDGVFAEMSASGWPWAPTGVTRQEQATYVLEHLRMPLVLLGNLGVGPYIRVRRVGAKGTDETLVVVWGRHSWIAASAAAASAAAAVFVVTRRYRRRAA